MDWHTTSALAAQRQAELARDAALVRAVRAGRAVRIRRAREWAVRNPKAREGAVGLR